MIRPRRLSVFQLDLNIFIQGVYGSDIYNETAIQTASTSLKALDYWTPSHQNTIVPSLAGKYYQNSSYWVEDGSYLRLKNITLAYQLSDNLLKHVKPISSLKIFVSAKNLVTWTNYTVYDPELATGVDTNAGVDLNVYPSTKSYTIGLDIKLN